MLPEPVDVLDPSGGVGALSASVTAFTSSGISACVRGTGSSSIARLGSLRNQEGRPEDTAVIFLRRACVIDNVLGRSTKSAHAC